VSANRAARRFSAVAFVFLLATLTAACAGNDAATGSPTLGPRPASTAKLSIVSPKDGAVFHSSTVPLRMKLEGARIVPATTTTNIQPDEGHLHVYLDNNLVTMTADLSTDLHDVAPGQHLVQVEFVANDHFPFDPRVLAAVAFEVRGA
jgi:hypothetical protein